MKTIALVVLLAHGSRLFAYDVAVRVVDDQGSAVPAARSTISFVMLREGADVSYSGITGSDGVFRASGRAEHSVYVETTREGYYQARLYRLPSDRDLALDVVIPRILDPVPLYAWDSRIGRAIPAVHFPVQNEWLGYDFEAGDWVQPHGKGKIADILFKFRNEFRGWKHSERDMEKNRRVNRGISEEEIRNVYGKWDAELDIAFAGAKEGLFEETRFLSYSRLKMPHAAPLEGYVPTWRYTANSYSPRTAREHVGFFLRTRVKLDDHGRILSANYAKVMGDFQLDPRGRLMFAYYFNPVPNERNLEFDPKRNLFPPDFPGSNVSDP